MSLILATAANIAQTLRSRAPHLTTNKTADAHCYRSVLLRSLHIAMEAEARMNTGQ